MATITKRGSSYRIRVYAGYDIDGRQIERTMTWTPPDGWSDKRSDKEARHQAEVFEEKIRTGEIASSKMKFSDFGELWFSQYAEGRLRPRTIARYRELWEKAKENLGYLSLEKIKPTQLLNFYKYLEGCTRGNMSYCCNVELKAYLKDKNITKVMFATKTGVSQSTLSVAFHRQPISKRCAEAISAGLELPLDALFRPTKVEASISASTIQHYHRLLSDILGAAVRWQYLPYNPCDRVAPPKGSKAKISYLDDVQAKELMRLLQQENGFYRRPISFLLLSGMRRGELLGLEWQDVDWNECTIHIERTAQYLPGRGVFTDAPKNKSSERIVELPSPAITILREQFLWQQRQKQRKDKWENSNRIFCSPTGSPMHPDRLTRWFGKFIKKTDLPPIHLHSLRHTYATLCIANNVPVTAVAAQLGHASAATTTTIYAHAIKSAKTTAASKIGSLFEDIIKTAK